MTAEQLRNSILQEAISGRLVPPACRQAGKTLTMNPTPHLQGKKVWFTYVIECEDGTFYKGFTDDLVKRYKQHCDGIGAEHTKIHKPKQLYYWEMHYSQNEAIAREKYLKSGSGREWFLREVVNKPENWEPASVLLEKIRDEKARLIKEGKLKKKDLEETPIAEDEIPFEIPKGWEWSRWGNLAFSIMYGYNAPAEDSGDIRMVRISDIQGNKVLWDKVPFCRINPKDIDAYLLRPNDILFARTGGTVGKSYIVTEVPYPSIYAGYLIRTQYSKQLCPQYLKYFMESQLYWSQLRDETIATAQPNCNGKKLAAMILPIPPLAEQKRIVAKLEELLPIVEQYGKAQKELDELNAALPARLRQSILQQAIQGKLVPQDPNEGTAEELVLNLQNAIKESPIKKKWSSEPIQEDELPFDIPANWQWLRLGDIVYTQTGLSYSKGDLEKKVSNPVRVLRGGNIQSGSWCIKDDDVMIAPEFVKKDIFLKKNSFITPAVTSLEHLGKTALIREDHNDIVAGGFVLYLMPYNATNDILMEYLAYFFQSAFYNSFCKTITNKSGQAFWNISREKLLQLTIPLPPLAEQRRIVAKIEELFAEIDKLTK